MNTKRSDVKMKSLRFLWGIFPWIMVALIVGFIVILGGRIKEERIRQEETKKASMKKEVPPVRVITLTMKPHTLVDKINLPGVVDPSEDLWVKAEVSGQVLEVLAQEGQPVKRNQILIQLDDRDYRSRLAQIEANYKLVRLNHDRIETLVKKEVAAVTQLDELEAQLKDLEARHNEAELALKRTSISSPISGLLNEIKAEKGAFLTIGDEVAHILQIDHVKVSVGVPESDVASVFDLNEADVIIDALQKRKVKGKKVLLSRKPRTLARLYDLELSVPNPDGRILPGMFARVELVKKTYNKALTVPLYAVISQGNDRFVFIENDGKAKVRHIELGELVGWQVHVPSGLSAGERVIVVGHRFLDNNQTVEVIQNVLHPQEIKNL